MHFFVTGHTGFKGSWLILLLKELGHEVSGYSLAPVEGGLFQLAGLEREVKHHFIGDIRDLDQLRKAMIASRPDFAIHMAAQPLVLRSYEDPVETYTTNVDGTLNFLRAVTELEAPPISLVVTTDKVYRDDGKGSYLEADPLGGHDPYSASKAMADILTQSWALTNPGLKLHVARAGNVIGAYDVSPNRLIPDVVKAIENGRELSVRHLDAVRPWQHVLDCLAGYYLFLEASRRGESLPIALNFGPDAQNIKSVGEVIQVIQGKFSDFVFETHSPLMGQKETELLTLNSLLAKDLLGWENQLSFEKSVELALTALRGSAPEVASSNQVKEFVRTSSQLRK
jgi:CDP-glucose 4,6-dehydratase